MTPEFVTIGVYGFDETSFFQALVDVGVDTVCDIRRRRGVRGAAYAFANSQRLQARLAELGIRYLHRLDLAPGEHARQQQEFADQAAGVAKRQREILDSAFIRAYRRECLADFDGRQFVVDLGPEARVVALLCVERTPAACHRSLLADQLAAELGARVTHILPG